MSRPTLTVCIITRNQRDFIEACVRSVAEQEVGADLRILIGDDASDDGTGDIVARIAGEHPSKVEHLRRHEQMGAMANMRDLMARADGDFVARVDGDDYWLPGKLQRQLDYLIAHPDCAAVYTNAITVDEARHRIGLFNDVGDARFDLAAMLRRGNFLNNSSVLFRNAGRHAWLDVVVPQIDYRVHLWLARHGWLGHIGEPLTAYRVNTRGSMVAGMNNRVRELYWDAILSVPQGLVSADDRAHGMADFLRRVILHAIRTKQPGLLRAWMPRVHDASPYGIMRTSILTASSLARITFRKSAQFMKYLFQRNDRNILYPR
jgi:glycosyltransferase involved in cell wall biosynthesis